MNLEINRFKCAVALSTVLGLGAIAAGFNNLTQEPELKSSTYTGGKAKVVFSRDEDTYPMQFSCFEFGSSLEVVGNTIENSAFTGDTICEDGIVTQADETEIVKRAARILPRTFL